MSRKKRRRSNREKPRDARPKAVQQRSRALVVIDQRPIRRAAVNKCKYILKQFDKVVAELDTYDNEDLPAYRSWVHANFGRRLTELREVHDAVHSHESLIEEIEEVRMWNRVSRQEAYRIAMDMRANPDKYDDDTYDESGSGEHSHWDSDFDDDEFDEHDRPSEEDLLELFRSMSQILSGGIRINEDSAEFRAAFEAFKKEAGFDPEDDPAAGPSGDDGREQHAQPWIEARLRALYRGLAKRLHPDNRSEEDPESSASIELWHRVQEAYSRGDIDELEMLHAQHDIRHRNDYAGLPVGQILSVHQDYKEQLRWIRRRHRALRSTAPWRFTKKSQAQLKSLFKAEERSLVEALAATRSHLAQLERILDGYRSSPRHRSRKRDDATAGQMSLF